MYTYKYKYMYYSPGFIYLVICKWLLYIVVTSIFIAIILQAALFRCSCLASFINVKR